MSYELIMQKLADKQPEVNQEYEKYKKENRRSKSQHKGKKKKQEKGSKQTNNDWDKEIQFSTPLASKRTSKSKPKINDPAPSPVQPKITPSEPPKPKTIEELHKEFKKKRKIKHIETSDDIDQAFKELPKRLRTRITKVIFSL